MHLKKKLLPLAMRDEASVKEVQLKMTHFGNSPKLTQNRFSKLEAIHHCRDAQMKSKFMTLVEKN